MSDSSSGNPPADPAGVPTTSRAPASAPATPGRGPDVLTALVCERCGNVNLVRVKGCWYCETCHYKFDCYGW
jgi:hypothetical protein